jgi:hypothetical protein
MVRPARDDHAPNDSRTPDAPELARIAEAVTGIEDRREF